MSMSKAKPAVAVCRAKIAWTVLVVLVRVIIDVNDQLVPQGLVCECKVLDEKLHLTRHSSLYCEYHTNAVIDQD